MKDLYISVCRPKVPVIFDENYQFQIGKAAVLREGTDVALIATGIMVNEALEAARLLEQEEIQAQVINVSTIKPLDVETIIKAAQETKAVVTCEEHNVFGGLGSAVAEALVENYPVPMERLGVKDVFGESGKPSQLLEKYGLTAKHIVAAAKRVMNRKR